MKLCKTQKQVTAVYTRESDLNLILMVKCLAVVKVNIQILSYVYYEYSLINIKIFAVRVKYFMMFLGFVFLINVYF